MPLTVPFKVNRNLKAALADQVAEGFKQAIRCGYYKSGEVLPTVRDLSLTLGVSVRITAKAVKILSRDGFISSRPRLGSVVSERNGKNWKGSVVLVFPESFGNYHAELSCRVQQALTKAGYACMQALIPGMVKGGKSCRYDISSLKFIIGYHVDFAILFFDCPAAARILHQHGIVYAMVGCKDKSSPGCVGNIGFDFSSAAESFVRCCCNTNIKSVVQICKGGAEFSLVRHLSKAGLKVTVKKVKTSKDGQRGRLWNLQQATIDLFRKWKIGESFVWPDLIYVTDDYVASAALLAFEHLRVQIPRDVKLVVFSNRGFGPVAWQSLARIENDAREHGAVVSEGVLEYLASGIFPRGLRLNASFVAGESFPLYTL